MVLWRHTTECNFSMEQSKRSCYSGTFGTKQLCLFWNEVLNLPLEQLFPCDDCGPKFSCMDAVSLGMMVDKVQKRGSIFVPIKSDQVLDAPEFKDRMFIMYSCFYHFTH